MGGEPCLVSRLVHFVKGSAPDVPEVKRINDPTLPTVLDAIKALDGMEIDTFSVILRNGDRLAVGGGKCDQYKCHATTNNSLYDLIAPNCPKDTKDTVSISMDNEESTYPRCCIVSLEMVMAAVQCFCTTGVLSPQFTWDSTLEYEPL